MKFTKMHGCGNDYVYIDCRNELPENVADLAVRLSDRHKGIGGDGIILICSSDKADFLMRIFNADGSEGRMCGNGIRCVGKYVYDKGMTDKTSLVVESGGKLRFLELEVENGRVSAVRVDMGSPELRPQYIPIAEHGKSFVNKSVIVVDKEYFVTALNVGNPHAVVFVEDVDSLELETIGPRFENHPLFPERVNTEFVKVIDRETLQMRVWERGSGETLACGTGATASAVAAILNGHTENTVKVLLRGGELTVEWDREKNHIYLTGPAVTVFDGELY